MKTPIRILNLRVIGRNTREIDRTLKKLFAQELNK